MCISVITVGWLIYDDFQSNTGGSEIRIRGWVRGVSSEYLDVLYIKRNLTFINTCCS